MRRRRAGVAAAGVALALALLAACGDDEPAPLVVTTPLPSATAGLPAPPAPAPTATGTAAPAPAPVAALAAYRALVADRQRSRSTFFAAVSDGRSRTVEQQRALARTHLAGLRRFATAVRAAAPGWPPPARTAARDLLAATGRQQAVLTTMTRAAGPGAFTAGLADYGVGVAAEDRAARAVDGALTP